MEGVSKIHSTWSYGPDRTSNELLFRARRAVIASPDNGDNLQALAAAEYKTGNANAVIMYLSRFSTLHPNDVPGWVRLATAYSTLKKFDEALLILGEILRTHSTCVEARKARALINLSTGTGQASVADLEALITLGPETSENYRLLADAKYKCVDMTEAVELYSRSICISPSEAQSHLNMAIALEAKGAFELAFNSLNSALELRPAWYQAWLVRGNILVTMNKTVLAVESFEKTIVLEPTDINAYVNLGILFSYKKIREYGVDFIRYATFISPADITACRALALTLLTLGCHRLGFREMYRCNVLSRQSEPSLGVAVGSNMAAQELVILAEEGLGDELLYASLLTLIPDSTSITLFSDKRLHGPLQRAFPKIKLENRQKQASKMKNSMLASAIFLSDLPCYVNFSDEALKSTRGAFLVEDTLRVKKLDIYKQLLSEKRALLVGISWKSSNNNYADNKSVLLSSLLPLLSLEHITFVCLQYDVTKDETDFLNEQLGSDRLIVENIDFREDIEGLLALISCCDYVITISNVTAHLAGSLGKKGIVLTPFGKGRHWYWQSGEGMSFWYPSLRLVSQESDADWAAAIGKAKVFLSELTL